jgi:PKD repeat protein
VTSADIQADTISGIAVPDAKVQVWCAFPDMCRLISRYVSADGSGNWTANYHIPGTQPDEQQTVDIQGGMAFIASVVDEDGDRTWFDWFVVPNPRFDVWPNGDGIEAWEWPKGDTLTLTIDNPNTAQNPDYTATEIVGDQVAPWNPTVTYVTFGSSGLYDIKLGDVVSISNGTITKTTVVTDLVMTHFDVVADTVSGIAAADSHIDFWVCDSNSSNCIPRHVNADHNGIWFIDLGHFGIENDEQNTLDLVHGTRVYSTQSDEDGDSTRYGEQINNPPQADAGPDQTILEGQTVILNASASSDPDGDALTYEWDFDNDGQFDDATGVAPSVTFADNGTFTVGLRVTDPFGLTSTDTTQVTVANVPPIVNIQHSSVNNLRVFTGDGSFIDPGTDTWTATVNYGDNTGTKNLPLNPDKSFALSHTYTCNGNYTVKVCVKDDDGGSGCNQVQITVKINHPPVAEADGPYFGNEGSSITLSGFKSTDPDYNIVRYEWDLDNDGQFDDATGVKVKFAAIDNGIFTIRLRVTDAGGLSSVDTSTIAVRNVPPVITSITLPTSIRVGTSLNARATFMDAGINDTFTAIWNWGDGSSSNGNVSGYTVTGSHMYSKPGTFTVTITIKDKDGGIGKTYMWIVVKK